MKKILGIILIIVLMGAFGCGVKTDTELMEDEVVDGDEITQEDIELIRSVESIDDCVNIINEEIRGSCEQDFIYQEALETQNPDRCNDLENETDKESCMVDAGFIEEES